MSKILIALGGNALGDTPQAQIEIVKETAKPIVDLIEADNIVIIAHGNGPQVGMINLALEDYSMPLPECVALSQGYIGYHLQNSILEECNRRNIKKDVVTLVTQVVVDEDDEAFNNPTKPIGKFYSNEEADRLTIEKRYRMVEDSGRGYRRVVASPRPIDIVEKGSIIDLINNGKIVITVGGGGIPVVKKGLSYKGIDGVIDKDYASGKLAELIDADYLLILTAVDRISINFGKPNQVDLKELTILKAKQYIQEGHFGVGSMLPKVKAAIEFVQSRTGRKAIITSLSKAKEALTGISGTLIH